MTDNYEVREIIDKETISAVKSVGGTYKYGFSTDIETEYAPLGLNEDIVRLISKKTVNLNGCSIGDLRHITDGRS